MRLVTGTALACILALGGPALAQNTNGQGMGNQASPNQNATLATANKIKQDLQNSGFTDVKVVAESFVVQAKTKDGDPVLMTVGPHGMSIFEAVAVDGANGSDRTGSTNAAGPMKQVKVSQLNDMKLYNAKGDVLGDIEQVVRGSDGRTSIVIGHGGILGLGEKQVAVPLDKVAVNGDRAVARGMTDEQIKAMPTWTKGGATELGSDQTVSVGTNG